MNYSPNDLRSVVAGEVRAHLARRELNANQVAAKLGWTQPYLWRRLTGKVAFNVADLAAIAKLLEVPVTTFFEAPGVKGSVTRALRRAA